jgi:hypothetical protein
MTLEALLHDCDICPSRPKSPTSSNRPRRTCTHWHVALRDNEGTPTRPDLRQLQRSLYTLLAMAEDKARAEQLGRISDRLVDNVNTWPTWWARGPQESAAAQQPGEQICPRDHAGPADATLRGC